MTPSTPPPEDSQQAGCLTRIVRCSLCHTDTNDGYHLPLYVIGSEGVICCLRCRIILTDVARGMMMTASRARIAGYKAAKQVEEAKAANDLSVPPLGRSGTEKPE